MADLPYSLEPAPGYNEYKVTSILKDYLAQLMKTPENREIIDNILKLTDDYIVQLKNLKAQNITKRTQQVYDAIDSFFLNTPEESKNEIRCKPVARPAAL